MRTLPGNAIVTLRYYLPDRRTGRLAGVPAPTFTMVTATGQRIPTPTCIDNVGDPGYTQAIAGTGQLRFWSMCTGNYPSTAVYACLVDKDVPVDRHGTSRFAISTAAARPANATGRCGVAWLPAGPTSQTVVIMRNMLPAPGFRPGDPERPAGREQAQMGPFYPVTRYYRTTSDFQRSAAGHPVPAGERPPHTPATSSRATARRATASPAASASRADLAGGLSLS